MHKGNHPSSERLLRTDRVCERLDIHPNTLRRWVKAGKIEKVELPSGAFRYREADVDALSEVSK